MTFGQATRYCLAHLTDTKGRARRAEFWWYYLAVEIVTMIIAMVMTVIFVVVTFAWMLSASASTSGEQAGGFIAAGGIGMVLWYLAVLVFAALRTLVVLAAWIRRLHDVGQSGHWLWLNLAGLGLVPLIMCVQDSQPYANQWGPDPKAAERIAYPPYQAPGYQAPGYPAGGYASPAPQSAPFPPPPAPPSV